MHRASTAWFCKYRFVMFIAYLLTVYRPPGHKETVEALVRRHSLPTKAAPNAANEMASMDLVKGKGPLKQTLVQMRGLTLTL